MMSSFLWMMTAAASALTSNQQPLNSQLTQFPITTECSSYIICIYLPSCTYALMVQTNQIPFYLMHS